MTMKSAVRRGKDVDDPIMLAVIQGALSNIQQEMTATLQASGRSNVATIARDYSHGIFDAEGELILQGEDLPVHLGSLLFGVKAVARFFGEDIHPGDLFYHNDPTYGGSHIPDMCAYKPVFVDDELAFWGVSKLHVVDAGGPVPSSYNADAKDIYGEGLLIPPIRLIDKGIVREDILNFVLQNLRTRENQAGDLRAQFGAVGVADKRLNELAAKYGLDALRSAGDGLKALADQQMRALISNTPDGVYEGRSLVEETGHGFGELEIVARVTVHGDEMTVALDSPPQIPFYINSYEANTVSAIYLAITMWAQLPPPYNEGLYRCITTDCGPEASLCNARFPAPCVNSTSCPIEPIADAVRKALLQADPRRAMAEWGRTAGVNIAGVDPRNGRYYVNYLLSSLISGAGAIDGVMDGWHMIGPADCLGALTCGDTELTELIYPLIVHEYSIREDSAGAGRFRGGCGNVLTIESLGDMECVAWGQGFTYPASGYGGAVHRLPDRKVAKGVIRSPDGSEHEFTGNRSFTLKRGQRYTSVNPGGGGCGDPFTRDAGKVLTDVRNRRVSVEAARIEYGVEIAVATMTVDEDTTARLRSQAAVDGAKESN
jgi:N-methylhydantoinase B